MVKTEASLKLSQLTPLGLDFLNYLIIVGSLLICVILSPLRLPGIDLMGTAPSWVLIWVVSWSMKRSIWQGTVAGICVGFIQDGLTAAEPTHALSLAIVGMLTTLLRKQRYVHEDFISVALIVFGMVIVAETTTAFQYCLQHFPPESLSEYQVVKFAPISSSPNSPSSDWQAFSAKLSDVWIYHQSIALSTAILTSLWAPLLYYPLNRWWEHLSLIRKMNGSNM